MSERATEQRLREIERARADQLDIARSWILLFTSAATFGLWWVFYNQIKLFYLSLLLGFIVAFAVSRILSSYVGIHLREKYDAQLKDQLLERALDERLRKVHTYKLLPPHPKNSAN